MAHYSAHGDLICITGGGGGTNNENQAKCKWAEAGRSGPKRAEANTLGNAELSIVLSDREMHSGCSLRPPTYEGVELRQLLGALTESSSAAESPDKPVGTMVRCLTTFQHKLTK